MSFSLMDYTENWVTYRRTVLVFYHFNERWRYLKVKEIDSPSKLKIMGLYSLLFANSDIYKVLPVIPYSQQSTARKHSSDDKIEYIMASMLIVVLDVW